MPGIFFTHLVRLLNPREHIIRIFDYNQFKVLESIPVTLFTPSRVRKMDIDGFSLGLSTRSASLMSTEEMIQRHQSPRGQPL